jgi:hypothetical protein
VIEVAEALRLRRSDGGQHFDQNVLIRNIDGKTALEKEIEYFGRRMSRYPGRNLIYCGKPLMLI